MATVQNPVINADYRKATNLALLEMPAINVGNVLQPVFIADASKKPIKQAFQSRTTTGSSTIFTTNPNQATFIYGYIFHYVKNAACDNATGYMAIDYVPFGQTTADRLVAIGTITLNAENNTATMWFNQPLRAAPNTTIAFTNNTFTAGVLLRHAIIYYAEESLFSNA